MGGVVLTAGSNYHIGCRMTSTGGGEERLSFIANRYARTELMFEIINRPFESISLDRLLMGLPVGVSDLEDFLPFLAEQKEDEFRDFANAHWSATDYAVHLINEFGTVEDTLPGDKLPDMKTQQYYEMIGKYDQFRYGWDDFDPTNFMTPHRNHYLNLRDDSNKLFDNARYSLIAIIGNHILSAFDAVWSVKRYNKKAGGFSQFNMKIRLVEEYDQNLSPRILLTYKF